MTSSVPLAPSLYRVRHTHRETADTWSLALAPESDADDTPRFAPGQFNMLYAFGIGEIPVSISGDPSGTALVHTVRTVGAVSGALCALRRGDALGVRGPFGAPWPVQEAAGRDVLLVAGGVGLAPLRPAFYDILAQRRRFGRVALLYGARSPDNLLFADELACWRARFDVEVEVTVDHATHDWGGHVGVVTGLLDYAPVDPDDSVAMLCGPEIMMRFVCNALRQRGMPAERIYVSLERNMQCGVGLCGHCQLGTEVICRDGPVYPLIRVERLLHVREL